MVESAPDGPDLTVGEPGRRRDRMSLRSRVTTTLLVLGVLSVVVLSTVNYLVVQRLLDRSVADQIETVRDEQADAVRRGFEILESRVAAIARDPALVEALDRLSSGYDEIDVELSQTQIDAVEAFYESEILSLYESAGVEHPAASDLVPSSAAGRYVQWSRLDDGGVADSAVAEPSAAAYNEAFDEFDGYLEAVGAVGVGDDLLLVGSSSGDVVYSTAGRIDLGTDLSDGPFSDSGLGRIADLLPTVAVGEPAVVDGSFYLPAVASPTIFVGASVRTDTEVIGAVVVTIPTRVLTDLTTGGGEWEELGLGRTGETYIVGSDQTLRTEPRRWLEDPEGYLERFIAQGFPEATADLIRLTDSTVLLQPVVADVVDAALDGDAATGRGANYLGVETLTAASPIDVAGLQWAIVAEQATNETSDSLDQFRRTALVVLVIELPIIAFVGILFARRVVRPIRSLVAYASELSNGEFDAATVDIGRDELGDIARQLEEVSRDLRAQERALADEETRITDMLGAVLPERLVDRVREGELSIADIADTATVVSISLVDLPDLATVDQEEAIDVTTRITAELARLAADHDLERVHLSPDHQIFVAGLGSPDTAVTAAMDFVRAVPGAVRAATVDTDGTVDVRVGAASGDVATGLLGTNQPSFGVWGRPTAIAVTLGASARSGQILVDASIADALGVPDGGSVPAVGASAEAGHLVELDHHVVVGDDEVRVFSFDVG